MSACELTRAFVSILREPGTGQVLRQDNDSLVVLGADRSYPIVGGIPVLLPNAVR